MMSSSEQTSRVKIIDECHVRPEYESEASKQPYYLGPIDLLLLSIEPMQKGLLFPSKPDNIRSDLLDKLKHSLSLSLVHFYPLAGRFVTQQFPDEHACWIYVDCNKGPGARLIHAVANDVTVSEVSSSVDVHPIVRSFFDLGEKGVNHDGHTSPLLSIQVTELLDGVFIGFNVNHSIGDGVSLWHFISSLSQVFQQLLHSKNENELVPSDKCSQSVDVTISRQPIYKPCFPQGFGPIIKLPYLEPDEFTSRFKPGPLRERIFHFPYEAIAKLKAQANEECKVHNINISSFQALSGFIWRSITRARNLDSDLETTNTLAMNFRTRLIPAVSENHFGNYIKGVQGSCKVGELLRNSLGWAALLVYQSVANTDNNAVLKFVDDYVKALYSAQKGRETAYYKPNSVLIAGSPKFDSMGLNLGLGEPSLF